MASTRQARRPFGALSSVSRAIPTAESLTIEFKSDRDKLPDGELVLAVVCLANTEGGTLYVGVEDDGTVTGLHPDHAGHMGGLAALVANRTAPPLSVRVTAIEQDGKLVAAIEVPRSRRIVATTGGTLQRRRLQADGKPECVPFLPHEFTAHQSSLGLLDHTAMAVEGATTADLDPMERERLRQAVERHGGDRALLDLDDESLDGALGLTSVESGQRVPTVAGMLLIGREGALRRHLPTHEVAFQVLEGTEVRVNDFYRTPLIRTFERLDEQFSARLIEAEIQVGLFRVPVPRIDRRAFRESLVNALTHRDYTRLGATHVTWQDEVLAVSNPGGFVDGVTIDNLLVVAPRPRNPRLADAFKRIGLAERTGRGVDLIYNGMLRYGRPAPSYARSDRTSVVVEMSCADADTDFLRMVLEEEERRGAPVPVDALIALSSLRDEKRVDTGGVAQAIQKDASAARAVLERLVEAGLVEAHGVKKGRTYTLSGRVYRRLGDPSDYVRQAGFDPIQQEQMVRAYVREHGEIRRRDVVELCKVSPDQAKRLLRRLVDDGVLVMSGATKGTRYGRGPNI